MRSANATAAVPVPAFIPRRSNRGQAIERIQKLAEMTVAHRATANEEKVARGKAGL